MASSFQDHSKTYQKYFLLHPIQTNQRDELFHQTIIPLF